MGQDVEAQALETDKEEYTSSIDEVAAQMYTRETAKGNLCSIINGGEMTPGFSTAQELVTYIYSCYSVRWAQHVRQRNTKHR